MKESTNLAIKALHGMSFETDEYFEQLKLTKRVIRMLIDIGANHPLKALIMIKRKLAAGRAQDITVNNIRKWGK